MTDYGRPLRFGYFLVPSAADPLLATAREAERRGLDYIGVQDHPYQRRFVDAFVLMTAIAASTSRIGVFPDVACLPLRPPAVLAKAAASIDVLSGGRFELGLGAGGFWDAIAGYGGKRLSGAEALAALEEAVDVIRLIWSGQRNLRMSGRHYHLAGVHSGPTPVHDMGIWLGVYGPRALRLAGRVADGWVPSLRGDPRALGSMSARLDDAAREAGRDPAAIRRVVNVSGMITDDASKGLLYGPVRQWIDELTDLALAYGVDTFMLSAEGLDQLPRFAEEVVPAVRQQVAAERGRES